MFLLCVVWWCPIGIASEPRIDLKDVAAKHTFNLAVVSHSFSVPNTASMSYIVLLIVSCIMSGAGPRVIFDSAGENGPNRA
jgi:hypothetical protein